LLEAVEVGLLCLESIYNRILIECCGVILWNRKTSTLELVTGKSNWHAS